MNINIMFIGYIIMLLSLVNFFIFQFHGGLIVQQNINISELVLGTSIWFYGLLTKSE